MKRCLSASLSLLNGNPGAGERLLTEGRDIVVAHIVQPLVTSGETTLGWLCRTRTTSKQWLYLLETRLTALEVDWCRNDSRYYTALLEKQFLATTAISDLEWVLTMRSPAFARLTSLEIRCPVSPEEVVFCKRMNFIRAIPGGQPMLLHRDVPR